MANPGERQVDNIFRRLPRDRNVETVTTLASGGEFELQRIVSFGQASAPDFWYDEPRAEWVLLLAGSAALLFEGEDAPRRLDVGDHVLIPAHCRHRVAWTDPAVATIWVVLMYPPR